MRERERGREGERERERERETKPDRRGIALITGVQLEYARWSGA